VLGGDVGGDPGSDADDAELLELLTMLPPPEAWIAGISCLRLK
jgi:hypothetical protein